MALSYSAGIGVSGSGAQRDDFLRRRRVVVARRLPAFGSDRYAWEDNRVLLSMDESRLRFMPANPEWR